MITQDLSREELQRYAREALTQPPSSAMWDERLYDTHGAIIGWADRGDDVLAESNYLMALEALNGVIAHTDGDPEDVLDTSASHWLVGSLRTVFVRVYVVGTEDGDEPAFTPVFVEACRILASLANYPILDESDYSEREYEAWIKVVDDGLGQAAYEYPYDSPAEAQAFYRLVTDRDDLMDRVGWTPDEVSYDKLAQMYERVRNEHFEWLARWHLYAPLAGEVPLF